MPLFTAFAPPAIGMRLEGSAARVIVTDTDQRPKLDALAALRRRRRCRIVLRRSDNGARLPDGDIDFADLVSSSRSAASSASVGGRGAMVRMYTSGTTGRPKGVDPAGADAGNVAAVPGVRPARDAGRCLLVRGGPGLGVRAVRGRSGAAGRREDEPAA